MFWNIEYKGKLKGDIEQISSGRPLSEGSVMFQLLVELLDKTKQTSYRNACHA